MSSTASMDCNLLRWSFSMYALLLRAKRRVVPYPSWLVRDVALVEGGRTRQRDVGVGVLVPRGRGGGLVGGLGADPHQKWPVSREERRFGPSCTLCVVGSLLGENVIEVVAIGFVAHDVAVLVEVVAQEVSRYGVPLLPAGRNVGDRRSRLEYFPKKAVL